MYEKHNDPLLSRSQFLVRMAKNVLLALLLVALALFIGMCGYHGYENMPWVDAFANAAMILSGMGPLTTLVTTNGKLFAGFYALFSGLVFIVIIGIIFAPLLHRFLHKFHLEEDDK